MRQVKFKIDENLPSEFVDILGQAGHKADTVRDEELGGKIDEIVAEFCQAEGRVLITLDRDFSDIRQYPPERYPGIIAISVRRQSKPRLLGILQQVLAMLGSQPIQHRLWIVEDGRIRIRSRTD
jgi:predicted nuclease of predicted toxin-antitoxin system